MRPHLSHRSVGPDHANAARGHVCPRKGAEAGRARDAEVGRVGRVDERNGAHGIDRVPVRLRREWKRVRKRSEESEEEK
jgi:hypothetical protein